MHYLTRSLVAFGLAGATSLCMAQKPFVLYGHTGQVVPASAIPKATAAQKAAAPKITANGITFNTTYLDGAGVGFNHATLGAARKSTMDAVLTYIANNINHPGAVCDVEIQASESDAGGALAFAGTYYAGSNAFDAGDCILRLTQGNNRFPSDPEILVTVDFGYAWNSELDAPTGSEFDLFSVLLHECTHAMGVASLATSSGASQGPGLFTTWDNMLYQVSPNTKVWSGAQAFQLGSNGLFQGDNTVRFQGTNATASLGTTPPIYTPNPYQGGSSVAHWQLTAPIPSNAVMRPSIAPGVQNRTFRPFEIQALKDLGFTLPASNVQDWTMY